MDISVLIFWGLMILFGIVLFSILPVLTFLLYRHLRKKGKVQKNIGLALFILATLGMILLGLKAIFGPSGFGPEHDSVVIEQKIGGKLLCNSVYTADLQSWYYNIDYKYIDSQGDTIDFKSGSYYNRDWNKDEQLFKYGKLLILKTGSSYFSDRLIIKNTLTDSTKIYDIYDQFIERDSMWKAQNIKSLLNYCCTETYIENIEGKNILIRYKFRTDEKLTKKYGERMIYYQIDNETGEIKMIKIT